MCKTVTAKKVILYPTLNQLDKESILFVHYCLAIVMQPGLDPEDPASQRPIAGLSYLSKLIEREVYIQLTPHLNAFNLLPLRQ